MREAYGLVTVLALLVAAPALSQPDIRLVLQITVDQLRGDLPWRHMEQFGPGGFRYLRDKGVWFIDARYRHANTETIVGHASLATGATPATHGSAWRYDQHVPVVFAGAGLRRQRVSRPVTPYDIAVTLSSKIGVMPPSGATGEPLPEVVDQSRN